MEFLYAIAGTVIGGVILQEYKRLRDAQSSGFDIGKWRAIALQSLLKAGLFLLILSIAVLSLFLVRNSDAIFVPDVSFWTAFSAEVGNRASDLWSLSIEVLIFIGAFYAVYRWNFLNSIKPKRGANFFQAGASKD